MSDEEGLAQVAKLIEDYEKCVSIEDAVHILSEIESYAFEGVADAAFIVGLAWFDSIYGEPDIGVAFQWFLDAASNGNSEAQLMLGAMYEKGWGVAKDESMAFKWKCESVKSGHPVALHNLVVSYFTGSGCDKDWCKAFDAMKKSADGGLLDAIGDVGMMYHYGIGVEQNFDEALKWYRKALELCGAEAEFKIWLIEECHGTLPCSKCR
ncbi:MAG: sel1 repeat family protein [Rikenellaceae bacterium]|nr:sel1 repeat family protein [Rikenellaceae bacterium]